MLRRWALKFEGMSDEERVVYWPRFRDEPSEPPLTLMQGLPEELPRGSRAMSSIKLQYTVFHPAELASSFPLKKPLAPSHVREEHHKSDTMSCKPPTCAPGQEIIPPV